MKHLRELINLSAKKHNEKHNQARQTLERALGHGVSNQIVSLYCEDSVYTHKQAVWDAAEELGLDKMYAEAVYAMRKSWPEALIVAAPFRDNEVQS